MKKIFIFVIYICISQFLFSQTTIDAIAKLKGIERINEFENYYYQNLRSVSPNAMFSHAKILENLSVNDKELLMIFRYLELFYWTEREEKIDLRNKYGKELDSLFKIMPKTETLLELKARFENIYGYSMYIEKGIATDSVIKLLQNSALYFQQKGFDKIPYITTRLNNLGNVYLKNKMYEEASYFFSEAVKFNHKAYSKENEIHSYNGLGMAYQKLKQYDAAINAFNAAKEISQETNYFVATAFLCGNIARCYLKLGKLTEAKGYFLEEIKILEDKSLKGYGLSLAQNYAGQTLIAALTNNIEAVDIYASKADTYFNAVDSIELIKYYEICVSYNEDMTLAFKHIGKNERSFVYAIRWLEALKIFNEKHVSENMLKFSIQFNTQFYKTQKDKAENRASALAKWLIATTIIGIIGLFVFLFIYIKQKKQIKGMKESAFSYLNEQRKTDMLLAELREKVEGMQMNLSNQDAKLQFLTHDLEEKITIIENLNKQLSHYQQNEIQNDLVYDKTSKMIDELKSLVISEKNWERFIIVLEQVYPKFLSKIQAEIPTLTPADIRLLALLKLKLDIRQISEILGISVSSIYTSKYRLRQKIKHLPKGDEIISILK